MRLVKAWARRALVSAVTATLYWPLSAYADEPAFRVRADVSAPLNADDGWTGEANEPVTVYADQPFRLRFEVPLSSDAKSTALGLDMRRNGGAWEHVEAHDFPYPKREVDFGPGDLPFGNVGEIITDADAESALRLTAQDSHRFALYPAPWPIPEFSYGLVFKLPNTKNRQFDLVFAYVDPQNHARLEIDANGQIRVVQVIEGDARLLKTHDAPIATGIWQQIEIELEGTELEVNFQDDEHVFSLPFSLMAESQTVGVRVPAGQTLDLKEMTVEGVPSSPRASIVSANAFSQGDSTEDLLSGLASPFTPGQGISLRETAAMNVRDGHHTEIEWPIVIRRFAQGAALNETGDVFEFRVVERREAAAPLSAVASVTLQVPDYHLGGTFVEAPGRIGPWQAANGDLFFIMEPAESDNKFMMVMSEDGGKSWVEVDGADRPETGDLEAVDGRRVADKIFILHQVTEAVYLHVFQTSDHETEPDRWLSTDELAASHADAIAQNGTLVVREDGSLVAVFLSDQLYMTIRDVDGDWSAPTPIAPDATALNAGPQAVLGKNNEVHLAYASMDGQIWYQCLSTDNTLSEPQIISGGAGIDEADFGAVLPLAYSGETDTLHIVYRLEDGALWERTLTNDSEFSSPRLVTTGPVITDAVDSQQPAADLVLAGGVPHVLFVDEETRSIWSTRRAGSEWEAPKLQVDGIEGSWVRAQPVSGPNGEQRIAYVYDAGSEGGAGLNRFAFYEFEGP